MNESERINQRLLDLLADQSLFELSAAEQAELRTLLANSNIAAESFETTAALAAAALTPAAHEPLPAHLAQKIAAAAPAHLATARKSAPPTSTSQSFVTLASRAPSSPATRLRETLAWFAAAACLLFALYTWSASHRDTNLTASEARATLLREAPDATKIDWTATPDPTAKGATGNVVWSNAKQQGYLDFKGLAKNDPKVNQYQLWIFDANQDERYPIDGGVFNIDSTTGDVVIPINAKLHVVDPKMFAITVEKPGGVVVSSRERIALLAKK
jgi:hypothetical protein